MVALSLEVNRSLPDHDLGTAHGRIEIDADIDGVASTLAQMAALSAAIAAVEGPVSKLDAAMEKVASTTETFAGVIAKAGDAVSGMASELGGIVSSIADVTGVTGLLEAALNKAAAGAIAAGQGAWKFYGIIKALRDPMGTLGALVQTAAYHFSGISKELALFPQWVKNLSKFSLTVAAVGESAVRMRRGFLLGSAAMTTLLQRTVAGTSVLMSYRMAMYILNNDTGRLGTNFRLLRGYVDSYSEKIRKGYSTLSTFTGAMGRAIVGAALMTSGLKKLGSTLGVLMSPKSWLFLGVIAAGLAAIGPVASVLLGVADALKQVAGAGLLLPGIIAAAGIAGGVMMVAFKGIGNAFKAAAMEGDEFDKALKDLSPGMQNVAKTAHEFKDEFKELKRGMEERVFHGFSRELKAMGEVYMPILTVGTQAVATALNKGVIGFMEFMNAGKTVSDVSTLFGNTSRIISNLAPALKPLLEIFRDLAVVGTGVLTDMTAGVGATTRSWANFISAARDSGQLRVWMEEGVEGIKDLGRTIRDVTAGIGSMFRAFGGDGENALARLAAAAERFRAAMETGTDPNSTFGTVIEALATTTERAVEGIKTVFEGLSVIITNSSGIIAAFGDGFSRSFIDVLQMGIGVISAVGAALSHFEIFGTIIGTVLGAAAAFKALLIILGPIIAILKVLFGFTMLARGFSTMMLTAAVAMDRFAVSTTVAGRAVGRLQTLMLTLGAAMSTGFLAIIAAIGMIALLANQANESHRKAQQAIQEDYEQSAQAAREFTDEVMKANGAISQAASGKMSEAVGKMRDAWEEQGGDDAKWTDNVTDWGDAFNNGMNSLFGMDTPENEWDSNTSKHLDEQAQKARDATAAMKELGWTNDDVADIITSSASTYAAAKAELLTMGEGGRYAAEEMETLRQRFLDTEAAAIAVGPAALEVSNGLKTLADDGASAADKLSGLMDVLRGLGLIETDAEAAAMALSEKLAKVVQEAEKTVNTNATMGIDLVDADTGRLDNEFENARALYRELEALRQSYLNVVAAGGDAQASFQEMLPTLIALGAQYGFNETQLMALIEKYGFVPDKIETIMSVVGKDDVYNDLTDLKLAIEGFGQEGVKKTVNLETEEAYNALRAFGVDVSNFNPDMGTAVLNIPPGMGDEAIAKINEIIAAAAQANPAEVPAPVVKPIDPAAMPPIPPLPPGTPPVEIPAEFVPMAGTPLVGDAAAPAPVPMVQEYRLEVSNFDEFNGKIAEAKGLLEGLNSTSFRVQIEGIDAAIAEVNRVSEAVNTANKRIDLIFTIVGHNEVIGGLQAIATAVEEGARKLDEFRTKIEEVMNAARAAVQNFANAIPGILDTAANNARGSGERLGQGFADGISSKAEAVRQAAMRLAEAASKPLPRSPAKEGPFSGKGWTPYRGISLAEGFAQGIMSGTPMAQLASLNMAQAVADAMDSVRGQFQMPQTSFSANSFAPGSKSYYRDPEITDEELAKSRQERRADEAKQARKQALRDSKSAANKLPAAEEKIVKANERIAKAEETLSKAKTDESRANAEESLRKAKEAKAEAERDFERLKTDSAGRSAEGASGGLAPNRDRTDYVTAMNEIAQTFGLELISGLREGDTGHHGSGTAGDFSNGTGNTDQQLAFAEFMAANFKPWIKELIYDDPRFAGKEIKDGKDVDSTFYDGAGDHTNHVHLAVNMAPEFTGQAMTTPGQTVDGGNAKVSIDPTRTDLTQDEVASLIIARGRAMGMDDEQISAALATGLVESNLQNVQGGPDSSTGTFQQQDFDEWTKGGTRNRMSVDDAATTFFEQLQGVDPTLTPGQQAQAVQRSAFPDKYDERMAEADLLLARLGDGIEASANGSGRMGDDERDALIRMRANDPALAAALDAANSPNSTDAEVIQALQSIDNSMMNVDELDQDILKAQKDSVMEDRGLKEYDPFEGALKTDYEKFKFGLESAQNIWGMMGMLKNGFANMKQVAELMIRGVSNTDDVHTLVDGFQGIAGTVGEVVSAVGSIASMVGTIAATAGMAIPGIGQIGAVVGAVTGGIADVNGVIDLVQDVMKAGGRMVGGALASFLGGENGQLQGNVKTLLDFNDNTIKSWGDRNPTDKTIRDIPFTEDKQRRDPNQAGSFRDLNVYSGPGGDPRDSMNAAMFAVKAHSRGVFA